MKAQRRASLPMCLFMLLAGCTLPGQPELEPLPNPAGNVTATPRVGGSVGSPSLPPPASTSFGTTPPVSLAPGRGEPGGGEYSLDFADTDVREAVAQILGGMLNLNYTIDPAVRGTVSLHTARPLTRAQLMPTLESLLAGVGAAVVQAGGLTRIVPVAAVGAGGATVLPLRYTSAEELVKVLQPLAGPNARITAAPERNAVVIAAAAGQVEPLVELVQSFDIDSLAGQSYAILPVTSGSAHDFADALREALHGAGAAPVRIVPLSRFDAVLVATTQPRFIDTVRRVYALVEHERRNTIRSWHVYYLQNSHSDDVAYTLQMAFTPNNVTAQPTASSSAAQQRRLGGTSMQSGAGGSGSGLASGGTSGGGTSGSALSSGGLLGGSSGGLASGGGQGQTSSGAAGSRAGAATSGTAASGNPLLGGLESGGGNDNADAMRILSNPQNNAVLIYATPQEEETVLAMLRKIDILPLQVRIDATIAEVTLNDQLQYGTQFFFKAGGINGVLSLPSSSTAVTTLAAASLSNSFPGFILGGNQNGGGPLAISMLQAITKVNVLSSPQIMVVDNQPARLQVGALVPYLTSQSQSTLVSNATVVNSVSYQPTGVILDVTPRVNSGGLVTLDISQEVSDVNTEATTTSGISSPQFDERYVTSRVVVQDGQTVGLAGLIRDTTSTGNQGIPWLKDIPVLGFLAGQQSNSRTRTELLVLITPHVVHDQRDARALTEDMREALRGAATMPAMLRALPPSGSDDPNARVIRRARDALTP